MKVILFVMIVLLSFASCNTSKKNTIEAKKIDMKFVRFDSIIHSWKGIDKDTFEHKVTEQIKAHGDFLEAFNTGVIKVGSAYNSMYYDNLHEFLNYPIYDEVQGALQQKLSNLESEKQNIQLAFGRFKTLYPKNTIPSVYFFNGVFNQSIVIIENGIGVGIDKYMGADCLFYKQMGMQLFQIKKMYKEKIPTDVLIGYLQTEFENNFADANLLANMIHSGRIMYLTQMLMPETPDTVLWGYSAKQIEFLNTSEDDMWLYLVNNKLLFDSDYMVVKKLIGDGPFTAYFSKESPPRVGIWIGYQIVQKYLENNPDVTIQTLMNEKDYQKIMNKAKYNP